MDANKVSVLLFTMTGFGNAVFKALHSNHHCNLIGVVTPFKPETSFPYYDCSHIQEEVLSRGISLYEGINLKDDADCKFICSLSPELIIVATFNQILPNSIIDIPTYGVINIHPSLLPKYRGATPTTWVLYNGEQQTGVTAHFMTDSVDKGDIILQRHLTIDINDTDGTLRKKLAELAGKMIENVMKMIISGDAVKIKQDEKQATYFPKRAYSPIVLTNKSTDDNLRLHNKIRSHLPSPGVQILHVWGGSVEC